MTFRQIDAFRAIMLTGTVTGAAKMLGNSQPAVSRLIADLERDLRMKLFFRSGRRLMPTSEANALFEEVRRSFAGLDRIWAAAEAIRNFQHERLCFVAIPSIGSTVGVDLAKRFGDLYPNASIALEIQPTNSAVEWVLSRQADFAIAHPHIDNPSVETRILDTGRSVCLLPTGHKLAKEPVLRPEHLRDESHISFRPDSVYRHRIDTVFRDAGIKRTLRYECRTTEAICAMVADGQGVAVVGPYLPRAMSDAIVIRPFEPVVTVELAAIWYANQPLSAIATRFLTLVEDYFATESIQSVPRKP